jgi:hypothetical protein
MENACEYSSLMENKLRMTIGLESPHVKQAVAKNVARA